MEEMTATFLTGFATGVITACCIYLLIYIYTTISKW